MSGLDLQALRSADRELRQRYRRGLAAKVAETEQLLQSFLDSQSECGARRLRRYAHNLAGSAGSFGFPVLGSLAKSVELAADWELGDRTMDLIEAMLRTLARRRSACDRNEPLG